MLGITHNSSNPSNDIPPEKIPEPNESKQPIETTDWGSMPIGSCSFSKPMQTACD